MGMGVGVGMALTRPRAAVADEGHAEACAALVSATSQGKVATPLSAPGVVRKGAAACRAGMP